MNRILLLLLFTIIACLPLMAQSAHRNILQIKANLYYFKGSEIRFNPYVVPFNLVYSRFLKGSPFFLGCNFSDFWTRYSFTDDFHKKRGDVNERGFITVGVHSGFRLQITPKRAFLAKAGLVYRLGWEQQFYSIINVGGRYESFSTDYKYRNPGIELSAEQQFQVTDKWSLNIGGGYQYFLSRTTTNHHLWVNAGAGYAF